MDGLGMSDIPGFYGNSIREINHPESSVKLRLVSRDPADSSRDMWVIPPRLSCVPGRSNGGLPSVHTV